VLERIADPFFTTRRNAGGLGLGLSVSARVVGDHDGRMHFASNPGQGTTVQVVLPVWTGGL
jgi:two-component system, NtrC family, sensor kinase